ncbi:MAG TPA: ABC transporter permease, partial [Ginsengibacter sp.]|nr:ABC transporter permease [Ginsengibacter sp.]
MFRNYFKIAWRNIYRNKAYSIINILGLALGICACIVIFLITSFEFSFDKFHPDRDRIYRIVGEAQSKSGDKTFLNNIIPDVAGFQNQIPGFDAMAAFHSYGGNITIPGANNRTKKFDNKIDGSFSSTAIITWPSYFSIFQYTWLEGNPQSLNQPFKVVLTESRAKMYFGNIPLDKMMG